MERRCAFDYNNILQVEPLEIDNWGTLECPANFRHNIQTTNARCFLTHCGSTIEKGCSGTIEGLLSNILNIYYNVDTLTLLHTAFPEAHPTFNFGIIDGSPTEALKIVGNYTLSIDVRTSVNLAYAALWYRYIKDLNPSSDEAYRLKLLIIAFFMFTCSDQEY